MQVYIFFCKVNGNEFAQEKKLKIKGWKMLLCKKW